MHAAIKFGRKDKLVKVTFFDFGVLDIVPFPDDYALVVCDSGETAQKTGSARDLFNHRICCYRIGFLLIKKYFPQYAPVLHHLRDVNLNALNIPLSEIYRILLRLPEGATRDELRALLPDEDLDVFFNQHHPPDDGLYPIRGVILFGLAEMERMVHISLQTKGVVGAQLAGAGLGGCMMVLAQRDAVSKLVANLTWRYYLPRAKDPTILVCRPVAGSAVLMRDAC